MSASPPGAPTLRRWTRRDFAADPITIAKRLLGARLVHKTPRGRRVSGIIIEVEAYLGKRDAAAHSYRGRRTARTEPMYGPPGTAYVYFTYGMHHCFNVVCGEVDEPVAVLVRALAPDEGIGLMRTRRGPSVRGKPASALATGPGSLCKAMGIDRRHSGLDLATSARLFIEAAPEAHRDAAAKLRVRRSPRIGVAYAGRWAKRLLRWELIGVAEQRRAQRDDVRTGAARYAR